MNKKGLIIVLVTLLISLNTENVRADVYLGYHVASSSITMVYAGTNTLDDIYSSGFALGMKKWNNTGVVNIDIDRNSTNKVYIQSYSDNWYGNILYVYNSSGIITSSTMKINTRKIHADFSSSEKNAAISVVSHEIGHLFGLADINNASQPSISIMNYARNRTQLIGPTLRDKNYVSALYE